MRPTVSYSLILLFAWVMPVGAQIEEDFSDHDLTSDPSWIGDLDRWRTGALFGSPALQSSGLPRSDTIHLALPTGAAFGEWKFTFAHRDVNLSTFNGARLFVSVDGDDPNGPLYGYFVQLGTNNSDALSLWRVDGGLQKRTELGRSTDLLVEGDSSLLKVKVERDANANWTVSVDDTIVLETVDARYVDGSHLLLWVKHTAQGADAFFFDDVSIDPVEANQPPPAPPSALPMPGDVVINEIQFDPLPGGSEFVELYNRTDSTFDLQSITFRDSRSPLLEVVDSTLLLPPGAFAVIVADSESFASQFRRTSFVEPSRWATLNNGGDSFVIEAGGSIVDSLTYGPDVGRTGFSLERVDPDGPSEWFNFTPSSNPFGATPAEINSAYAPDVTGPVLLFAEQRTPGRIDLTFSEPLEAASVSTEAVRIGSVRPDSIAHEDGLVYAAFFSQPPVSNHVEVEGATDRRGNVSNVQVSPIAFVPAPGDLIVNEIMYEPLSDAYDGRPNQSEYIEIHNRSSRLVTIGAICATRRAHESGDADTLDVSLPLAGLEPGAMLVIAGDSSIASALPDVPLRVASSLSLPNGGDLIRLHNCGGVVIDSVHYHARLHHPDQLVSRGVSLERVDIDGPSDDPSNWTSSVDPVGGSPGRSNSVVVAKHGEFEFHGVMVEPNPFTPDRDGTDDVAKIAFHLRADVALVRIRIFDLRGQKVRELVPSKLVGKTASAYWDGFDDFGRALRMGVYILLLEAYDNGDQSKESYKEVLVLARGR